jgi:hypothetical protein
MIERSRFSWFFKYVILIELKISSSKFNEFEISNSIKTTYLNIEFFDCIDNACTMSCALKREQVVFIRRKRFHSTHLKKWFLFNFRKNRLHSTHSKKSFSFISFEQIVFIRSSLFLRISFNSFEKVVIYLINLEKSFFIQLIWKRFHSWRNFRFRREHDRNLHDIRVLT